MAGAPNYLLHPSALATDARKHHIMVLEILVMIPLVWFMWVVNDGVHLVNRRRGLRHWWSGFLATANRLFVVFSTFGTVTCLSVVFTMMFGVLFHETPIF